MTEPDMADAQHVDQIVRPLHVVFLHLDLGIGGAEQLVLQLATASHESGHRLNIVTTRCDANHCFAAFKPETGFLAPVVHVWGRYIPSNILGKGQALCSTVRLMYLACRMALKTSPDVIVVDVLPTALPLLRMTDAAILFYCHFPDKLLIRQQAENGNNKKTLSLVSALKKLYRWALDSAEERTMRLADKITVNSKFTRQTLLETFPSLATTENREVGNEINSTKKEKEETNNPSSSFDPCESLPVLYPALDTTSLNRNKPASGEIHKRNMIVSLNRFERKKNLGLLLEAAFWLEKNYQPPKTTNRKEADWRPEIVIAGGYDELCTENVEHRAELGIQAQPLQDAGWKVSFQHSISDETRANLLRTARAVVYTPDKEHFGIVPLEAMYAGTPVIAVNSGGPTETVRHEETGFLCQPTAESFGRAMATILADPAKAAAMGQAGRDHVHTTFGKDRLKEQWKDLLEQTLTLGRQRLRRSGQFRMARIVMYIFNGIRTFLICLVAMATIHQLGIFKSRQQHGDETTAGKGVSSEL